ncbi:unnamed protein product [Enterobius vermicularis]|uniref:Ground-like domain-containing protein n=1 Tax=Enterobius vermicularis TaxID=51028 RepID=A0A158QA30_ENTVE|nr:unnamed protein product [Enterobius vermicularis]
MDLVLPQTPMTIMFDDHHNAWILFIGQLSVSVHLFYGALEAISSVPTNTDSAPIRQLLPPPLPPPPPPAVPASPFETEAQRELARMFHLPADIVSRLATANIPSSEKYPDLSFVTTDTPPVITNVPVESSLVPAFTRNAEVVHPATSTRKPVMSSSEPSVFYLEGFLPDSRAPPRLQIAKHESNNQQQLSEVDVYDKQSNYAYSQFINPPSRNRDSFAIVSPAVAAGSPTFEISSDPLKQSQIIPLNDRFELYSHSPVIPKKFPQRQEFRRKQISSKILEGQIKMLKKLPPSSDIRRFQMHVDGETDYLGQLEQSPKEDISVANKFPKSISYPEPASDYFKSAVMSSLSDDEVIPEITPLLISNNQDQQSSGSQYNQFKQDENYDGAEDVKKGTWKVRDYFRSKIHRVPPQQVVTELPITTRNVVISVSRQFCSNLRSFARQFSIGDVAEFANTNCDYIRNYYSELRCSDIEEYAKRCVLITRRRL